MLDLELKFYEEHKRELIAQHVGKFALIKGAALVGAFSTLEEAYIQCIERFGNVPVLIRRILRTDPEHAIPAFTQGLISASF